MHIYKIARLLLSCLLLLSINNALAANWIKTIRSNSLDDKLQIVIDLEEDPEFKVFVLSNPIRLVIDVQGRPVVDFSNQLNFKNRGVRNVRTGMSESDRVRFALDLYKDFEWKVYEMKPDGNRGHRVVIDVFDYSDQKVKNVATVPLKTDQSVAVKTDVAATNQRLVLESTLDDAEISVLALKKENEKVEIVSPNFLPEIEEAKNTLKPEKYLPTTTTANNSRPPVNSVKGFGDIKKATVKNTSKSSSKANSLDDIELIFPVVDNKTTTVLEPKPVIKSVVTTPEKPKKKGKDLIVMIDPGHGGKDSGAVGKGGTYEKHIVLQIAKRLKKRIDNTKGMRAILTRSSNKYVTLRGRLALADKHKPDLFVSIHADAAQNRSAKGSSVFILSNKGASSKTAKWIAKRENAVDSKYGSSSGDFSSDVSNVLLGMQQDITIEGSHQLGNKTLSRLKRIGKVHKKHVERAGFAVLKSPSIPSMLVETAFISNPDEERKLKTPSYQKKIAEAVAKGVEEYFRSRGQL